MKDLKNYNKLLKIFFVLIVFFFLTTLFFNYFGKEKTKFYYLTSYLSIEGETQILPSKYNMLQLVKFYFSGPIDVKKFKKDYFQQIEIDNVYFIDKKIKIILSNDSSSLFLSYQEIIKEKISEATILTLRKNKLFKNANGIEIFIFNRILAYSYEYKK